MYSCRRHQGNSCDCVHCHSQVDRDKNRSYWQDNQNRRTIEKLGAYKYINGRKRNAFSTLVKVPKRPWWSCKRMKGAATSWLTSIVYPVTFSFTTSLKAVAMKRSTMIVENKGAQDQTSQHAFQSLQRFSLKSSSMLLTCDKDSTTAYVQKIQRK